MTTNSSPFGRAQRTLFDHYHDEGDAFVPTEWEAGLRAVLYSIREPTPEMIDAGVMAAREITDERARADHIWRVMHMEMLK
jgi:hypothetical protein